MARRARPRAGPAALSSIVPPPGRLSWLCASRHRNRSQTSLGPRAVDRWQLGAPDSALRRFTISLDLGVREDRLERTREPDHGRRFIDWALKSRSTARDATRFR